jgi:hypothetical protein
LETRIKRGNLPSETSPVKESRLPSITIPEQATGLFHKNYDRILADDSLSDKDVVLISLYLLEDAYKHSGIHYDQVKQLFTSLGRKERPNFSVNIHNATKEGLIQQDNSVLSFLAAGLKRIEEILGLVQRQPVYLIKSGQHFTATKRLEEFLSQEIKSEDLLLCDSHISSKTLFPLSILTPRLKSVKILALQVHDPDKFREYRNRMTAEYGIAVEVRISKKVHDRYLITGDKCWSFGTSIQDLGNKDTIIHEISGVTDSMKDLFSERWDQAANFA